MASDQLKLVLPHERIKQKLDEAIKKKGLVKYNVELSPGSKPGDNYGSKVYKITINGLKENGDNANLHLFCKLPAGTKGFEEIMADVFLREIKVYEDVLFEMKKLEGAKPIEDGFYNYPDCLGTSSFLNEEFLIMEDITKRNFSMFDRMKKLDFNHTKLVMQAIGKLHAYSFAMRDQKPELLKKFSEELFEVAMKEDLHPTMVSFLNNFLKSAVDKLKFEGIYQKKWETFYKNYFRIIKDCCKGELAEPYAAINHGDCWNNNMMYRYENGVPVEVCLLDWQGARYASPVLDIVYYMFVGTEKSFRDEHYQQCLHVYYESFSRCLKQLGSDPGKLYPYSEFENQLKKFGKFGLAMAIMVIPIIVARGEDALVIENMIDDSSSATDNKKTVEICNTRLSDCLKDIVDLGYL